MRIYDCFTFYNEIEVLKIRLKLLGPLVDYFVIVECDHTQRGDYKGFNLLDNLSYLELMYRDKIRYIKVEDAPRVKGNGQWEIEHYQRNCILRGLYDCNEDDLIMVSDLDEIPDPKILSTLNFQHIDRHFSSNRKLSRIKELFRLLGIDKYLWRKYNLMDVLEYTPVSLRMRMFYYYMNCEAKDSWYGTIMTKFKNLVVPQSLRMKRMILPSIDGGWHFSYLGGVERIKVKLSSIVDDTPQIMEIMEKNADDDAYIEDCLAKGIDIYGRKGKQFEYEFINLVDIGLPNIMEIVNEYPIFFRK